MRSKVAQIVAGPQLIFTDCFQFDLWSAIYDVLDSELDGVYLVVIEPSDCLKRDLVCYCSHNKVFLEKKCVFMKGCTHESAWTILQDCCVEFPALDLFVEKYSNEIFKLLKLTIYYTFVNNNNN